MNSKILCTLLIAMLLPILAIAQKKGKIDNNRPNSAVLLLQQAEAFKEKDPVKAISQVEQVIKLESGKKSKSDLLGEAYYLLGNIYEQITQNELAKERYILALQNTAKNNTNLRAKINYRLGKIDLENTRLKSAIINFQTSLDVSQDDDLKLKSEEGIIDAKILMNDNVGAIKDLERLPLKYTLDSLAMARLEARKTQVYVQTRDYTNAQKTLQNTYNTIPKNMDLELEEIQPVEKANEDFFNTVDISNAEKIEVQNTIDYASVSKDKAARENFRKYKLLEEDNSALEAAESLNESKRYITPKTDTKLAVEVYKESYEKNLLNGRMNEAFEDLQKYITAKENEIRQLESTLNKELEIVKGQKKIDLTVKDFELEKREADLLQNEIFTQRIIIGLLLLILIASGIFLYFLFKNIKAKRKANQMLYLKSLRTQMNPHFIFNALNSVNSFIAQNDEKTANKFLSEFSQLMRHVLDYSQKDFINIQDEIELNKLYLKLEHFRFRDKFEYRFETSLLPIQNLEVPPMLIQPFIENAVWHGLRYKEEKGFLNIYFEETNNHLIITIEDDGIGRENSVALKTKNQKKYNSTGLKNVSKRIQLINDIYDKNYTVSVEDLYPDKRDCGTKITLQIPIH